MDTMTIKKNWEKAIAMEYVLPHDVYNYEDGIELLSNELCGPNDIRLVKKLDLHNYPIAISLPNGEKTTLVPIRSGENLSKVSSFTLFDIFQKYFSFSVKANSYELFSVGIIPTCAYVAEFVFFHHKDIADGTNLLPILSRHILPQLNPQTNFLEYNSCGNRRIVRACDKVITLNEWINYYTASCDTIGTVNVDSMLDALKYLPEEFLSPREKMNQLVECHGLILFELKKMILKQYNIRNMPENAIDILLEKPQFLNNTVRNLTFFRCAFDKLVDTRALFFNQLTDEQNKNVESTIAETKNIIDRLYLALIDNIVTNLTDCTNELKESMNIESVSTKIIDIFTKVQVLINDPEFKLDCMSTIFEFAQRRNLVSDPLTNEQIQLVEFAITAITNIVTSMRLLY